MGLGPIFTEIQQTSYDDLPIRWQTDDIQTLINLSTSYGDEKLAVRERNRMFKEANIPTPTPKPNPTNKRTPQADRNQNNAKAPTGNPSWSGEKNRQRRAKIESDIKSGIFDPMTYVWEVRPKNCIWHDSNTHHMRDCLKINTLLKKYPNQRYYHNHNHQQQPASSIARQTPAPRPRNPSSSRDNAQPSARHTMYSLPSENDVPSLDTNPFSDLCIDSPDEETANNSTNSINNSVTNYSITCKSVKISFASAAASL